jgi:thiol-disulfide isomerase/thioredoxin
MEKKHMAAWAGLGVVGLVIAVAALTPPRSATESTEPPASTTTGPVASPAETPTTATNRPDLPILRAAPALQDLDGWLQTDISSLDELRGSVVVLQFWTYSCSNCKATIPYLQDLYRTYQADGLEIVGVHAPEFEFEKDTDSILEAARRLGVTWPIALDTNRRNFRSWQGGPAYWPRTYVIDQNGQIRFDHIGEGAYEELDQAVATLLGTS